jgi:hypothetical protein
MRPLLLKFPASVALLFVVMASWSEFIDAQERPQVSTKDELARCMADGDSIESERQALESAGRRLEAAQNEHQTLSRIHAANRPVVIAQRSRSAQDAYNGRAEEIRQIGSRLNVRVTSLLERQNRFNARVDDVNKRCAGMMVSTEDNALVILERLRKFTSE